IHAEHRTPSNMFNQPAADHWSDSSRDCTETGPGPNCASPFVLWKRTANNCETTRYQQRGTKSLHSAGDNQLMNIGSKSAPSSRPTNKHTHNNTNEQRATASTHE